MRKRPLSPGRGTRSFNKWKKSEALDEGECFFELRELPFIGFELRRMNATSQAAAADGMLEVEHLVVEQVLDCVARAGRAIEDAAYDDGVVRSIVVAERALGVVFAPGEVGAAEKTSEEAQVQRVEHFFKVVVAAFGSGVALASAGVADQLGLAGNGRAGGETLEAQVLRGIDGLAVELGEEDVGDGAQHALRRAFEQVRETDKDAAFAQADGGVQRGESAETDEDGRHGRPRTEGAILLLKNCGKIEGHQKGG